MLWAIGRPKRESPREVTPTGQKHSHLGGRLRLVVNLVKALLEASDTDVSGTRDGCLARNVRCRGAGALILRRIALLLPSPHKHTDMQTHTQSQMPPLPAPRRDAPRKASMMASPKVEPLSVAIAAWASSGEAKQTTPVPWPRPLKTSAAAPRGSRSIWGRLRRNRCGEHPVDVGSGTKRTRARRTSLPGRSSQVKQLLKQLKQPFLATAEDASASAERCCCNGFSNCSSNFSTAASRSASTTTETTQASDQSTSAAAGATSTTAEKPPARNNSEAAETAPANAEARRSSPLAYDLHERTRLRNEQW